MSTGDPHRDAMLAEMIKSESIGGHTTPDDFAVMMAQTHYLLKDDDVLDVIKASPRLKRLMPALSHLLRTTNITDKKTIIEMKLRWKIAVRYELFLNSDEAASMAEYHAWVNYGYAAIEDTVKGWRGRLTTERIKAFKLENTAKQGGLLSWLRR